MYFQMSDNVTKTNKAQPNPGHTSLGMLYTLHLGSYVKNTEWDAVFISLTAGLFSLATQIFTDVHNLGVYVYTIGWLR